MLLDDKRDDWMDTVVNPDVEVTVTVVSAAEVKSWDVCKGALEEAIAEELVSP